MLTEAKDNRQNHTLSRGTYMYIEVPPPLGI